MPNHDDPLGAALSRLAHPFQVPTLQGEHGDRQWLSVIEHDSLLAQLRGAVVGGTGQHAGASSSDPRARLPFDPGAQAILDNIARIVAGWYARTGYRPVGLPLEGQLALWADWYRRELRTGGLPDGSYQRRVARINAWCDQIEALFDPPTVVPLDAHCPTCKRRRVTNSEGEHVLALVVEYWHQAERVVRCHGRCRGADCAAVWEGWEGVSELMASIHAVHPEEDARVERALTGAIAIIEHTEGAA